MLQKKCKHWQKKLMVLPWWLALPPFEKINKYCRTVLSGNKGQGFGRQYFYQNPWTENNSIIERCRMFLLWCSKTIQGDSGHPWPNFNFLHFKKKLLFQWYTFTSIKMPIFEIIWRWSKAQWISDWVKKLNILLSLEQWSLF